MQKLLFRIDGNDSVAKDIFSLRLSADIPVAVHSGQFVDIALDGFYLRRPISVCDCGPEGLTLVYKTVGEGTHQLSKMKVGAKLNLLIGLGHGFSTDACKSAALLAGGGLGAAPLHLLCKELLAQGKAVTVALGFNSADDIVLVEEYRKMGVTPLLATMDGSVGTRGFVTDAIAAAQPQYDFFYTCGPMKMMQAVCSMLKGDGEASLEERMGCGAGYCYGCSCHTTVGTKRICKDGPVFRKEEIIW
jgi:dihydroorotate dehydrogenase electron transfer subunit